MTIFNHCKWKIVHLNVHFNRHFTQTAPTDIISLERIRRTRQIQKIETTWWLPLFNVKVVSRYIALVHDTYREPPYRYCIDISPYRLIPIVHTSSTETQVSKVDFLQQLFYSAGLQLKIEFETAKCQNWLGSSSDIK